MTKILNGSEIAGFIKNRQAQQVKALRSKKVFPHLAIIRNSNNPVIEKYVGLKKQYGKDIGIEVSDFLLSSGKSVIIEAINMINANPKVQGLIIQLPLVGMNEEVNELVEKIDSKKDLDGLSSKSGFDSATATAINWLLASYDIELAGKNIAIVGKGRLVGGPLARIWLKSGLEVRSFGRKDDLNELINYDIVVGAAGVAGLIRSNMIRSGAVVVDAGTTSERGIILGDVAEEVRERRDLLAITPKFGGVGPLTIATLFENLLTASLM